MRKEEGWLAAAAGGDGAEGSTPGRRKMGRRNRAVFLWRTSKAGMGKDVVWMSAHRLVGAAACCRGAAAPEINGGAKNGRRGRAAIRRPRAGKLSYIAQALLQACSTRGVGSGAALGRDC